MQIDLYTTPTCTQCTVAKKHLLKLIDQCGPGSEGLRLYIVDTNTPRGMAKSINNEITTVPTVVVTTYFESGDTHTCVYRGIEDIIGMTKHDFGY